MRSLALAALAALTLGLMDARPADAARAGDKHASHHAERAEKAAARKAERRARRAARHARKHTRSARHHARKEVRYAKPRAAKRRAAAKRTSVRRAAPRRAAATRSVASGGSTGIASYYWQPQRVASGGWFNPNALTAAHRTLPFGTRVRVTNKRNGKSVVVTINDRGPFIKGRIIDLSKRAAGVIGMQGAGLAPVSVQVVGRG